MGQLKIRFSEQIDTPDRGFTHFDHFFGSSNVVIMPVGEKKPANPAFLFLKYLIAFLILEDYYT